MVFQGSPENRARTGQVVLDVDPWQQEVIEDPARIKTVMGGRGVGKTVGCARNALIFESLSNLGHEYAYFGPSYATGKREARAISRHKYLKSLIDDYGEQPFPYITWRTGSSIYFRSLDREENVLGYHLNGIIVDEIHKIGERALDEIVRPQIGAKRGWMLLIGQHDEDGEEGWINKRFFEPGQVPNQNRIRSWRVPSGMGRMYQGPDGLEELAILRETTPEFIWRWQYMAEAVESQNKAFRNPDIQNCLDSNLMILDRGKPGKVYAIGYDIGKVVDPSGEVVLEVHGPDSASVVKAECRPLQQAHAEQTLHLSQLCRVFNEAVAVVDATGTTGAVSSREEPDAYSRYYRQNCPTARAFYFNQKSKMRSVQDLQLAIEQGKIRFPAKGAEALLRQLQKYRWEIRSSGMIDYHGPNGHEDDLVMALVMAWQCVVRGWSGTSKVGKLAAVF